MTTEFNQPAKASAPRMPPRWVVRVAWVIHRAIYRLTPGRFGLWQPAERKWGAFRITTVGRKSGRERQAILGYIEDGANLVTVAMNGWAAPEPAWWLNLQANPEATVELTDGVRRVRGRAAAGDEVERLWSLWREIEDVDGYRRLRPTETALVILEPR
jgi:F420H(2)-dependent quinone reductase